MPAGHDRFDRNLIEEHLGPLRDELGISFEQLMGLGRVEPQNEHETFCMTVLGLKLSRRANAVSNLHGHVTPADVGPPLAVARRRGNPHRPHHQRRAHPELAGLADAAALRPLLPRRLDAAAWASPRSGRRSTTIDPGELWETHYALKNLLLAFVRRRVSRQCRRRGESDEAVEAARNILDPERPHHRLRPAVRHLQAGRPDPAATSTGWPAMVNDPERPVQIIFAGKAHPADEPGKQLIQRIANLRHDPRFAGRIAFVEDYDINVCRHLIQGVDVWLNNPRRPLEASGTSGQKAVLNGALNLSILDGWWAEAYDGTQRLRHRQGHAATSTTASPTPATPPTCTACSSEEVIPLYYDRDIDGLPRHWIKRMMNSISSLAWRFSADRMVADYVRHAYLPAAGGLSCDMNVK